MRKGIVLLCLLALLLSPLCALAAEDALFPARGENGLWGFIDRTGQFVIPPRYEKVSPWRGRFAAVTEDGENWGIVDETGALALPLEYVVEWNEECTVFAVYDAAVPDIKASFAVTLGDTVCGLLDTKTGFFTGFRWKSAALPWYDSWLDAPLLPVRGENGLWGFVKLDTGEQFLPCQFAEVADDFHEGWAIVRLPPEGGQREGVFVLVSEGGEIVYPPEGLEIDPWSRVREGLVAVRDPQTDEAGYMDVTGHLAIPPQWIDVYPFQGDFAVVWASPWEGIFQYVDQEGNILAGVRARPDGMGGYAFVDGLTSVAVEDPESGHWWPAAMNERGEIVFTLADSEIWLWNFMDNGLVWYTEWRPEAGDYEYEQRFYGLMDREGNKITDSIFKCIADEGSPFAEGVAAARIPDGGTNLYGYIDETGNWAIAPNYPFALSFENGLAVVETADGRGGYIDHEGKEVYLWKTDEKLSFWQSDLPQ